MMPYRAIDLAPDFGHRCRRFYGLNNAFTDLELKNRVINGPSTIQFQRDGQPKAVEIGWPEFGCGRTITIYDDDLIWAWVEE